MKAAAVSAIGAMLLITGCSSKPQPAPRKMHEANQNTRHWTGTTEALKNYRLPDSPAGKRRSAGFGFSKQKATGKEGRQQK